MTGNLFYSLIDRFDRIGYVYRSCTDGHYLFEHKYKNKTLCFSSIEKMQNYLRYHPVV